METKLRFILLIVGAIIILAILWDGLRRKKRKQGKYNSVISRKDNHNFENEQIFREEILGLDKELTEEELAVDEPKLEPRAETSVKTTADEEQDFTKNKSIKSIYIMAPENRQFGGYELLQTILANDLHYGDMQIFHRYDKNKEHQSVLFSLVSATEPGDFDLSKMETFSCKGLILFMNAANHKNPKIVLDEMVATAKQLTEDLGGELKSKNNQIGAENRVIA